MPPKESTEPRLASTVLIMRQATQGLEVLLLRRNAKLAFAAGAWVFPGGAVDKQDSINTTTEEQAARLAAVRESQEECGIKLQPSQLVHISHWTTPQAEKRRFATWFFAVVVDTDSVVTIDDGEIHDYQWLSPAQALVDHRAGELKMMPPTHLSIKLLEHFQSAEQAYRCLRQITPCWVTPKLSYDGDSLVALYPGDAGFEAGDAQLQGPRHRSLFAQSGISYLHSGDDVGVAPLDSAFR